VLSSMASSADWSIGFSPDDVVAAAGRVVALAPGDGVCTDEQPAISTATTAKKLVMWIGLRPRRDCDCATLSTGITRALIHALARRSPGGRSPLLRLAGWWRRGTGT